MKKFFLPALMLGAMVFACQKDKEVSPTSTTNTLSAEEQRVANQIGGLIPMKTALGQIDSYRQEVDEDETRSIAFGKTTIDAILSQKGCVGVRAYFVKDNTGRKTLVLVGIDKDKKDIQSSTDANARTNDGGGKAGGGGPLCPPECN